MDTRKIVPGAIVTRISPLGDYEVRVLSVNRGMNTAVIQFRELDQTPHERNVVTVVLDMLRPKEA